MRRAALLLAATLFAGCDGAATPSGRAAGRAGRQVSSPQWFEEITDEVGVTFVHESGARGGLHMPEIMAGGAALLDYDNDGRLDVYLTTGNAALPDAKRAPSPLNRLYRQQPDGRFEDVTHASGLGDGGYGMGVAVGDIDNDGYVDVYVTNYGPDRFYRNRGNGTFEDVTAAAGIAVDGWSSSAAFFDYDRDGYLDLYVARYLLYDQFKTCADRAGRPDYCTPKAFQPVHDVLLHNNGDPGAPGFTDVSESAGIRSIPPCAGLGVICTDLDADGWPDVYVAND
ncbi:MAG: FG-GAP repeat domain-containing protein, partial [Planctomycetota bacterium]